MKIQKLAVFRAHLLSAIIPEKVIPLDSRPSIEGNSRARNLSRFSQWACFLTRKNEKVKMFFR
jgi:hypothetical protein